MNKTKIGICTIGAVVILAGSCMIGSTYAANRTKADQRVTATAVRAVEPSNDTLIKAISRAVPEEYQVSDYQKDLCEDNFAQGGFLITADKKPKLDQEAINQEWSSAGIIAKWDISTLKKRFNADGKKDEKEIVKDLLENLHTSVSKKSEPYGEDIAFDMSKDLYTAAYTAKLGDKAKNLESEAKYKVILLQEQNTIYALLFNKKYFDITSMKNVYDAVKVQSATASPIATEMQNSK